MNDQIKYILEQLKEERERFIRISDNEARAGNFASAYAADEKRKAIGIAISIVKNAIVKFEPEEKSNDFVISLDAFD